MPKDKYGKVCIWFVIDTVKFLCSGGCFVSFVEAKLFFPSWVIHVVHVICIEFSTRIFHFRTHFDRRWEAKNILSSARLFTVAWFVHETQSGASWAATTVICSVPTNKKKTERIEAIYDTCSSTCLRWPNELAVKIKKRRTDRAPRRSNFDLLLCSASTFVHVFSLYTVLVVILWLQWMQFSVKIVCRNMLDSNELLIAFCCGKLKMSSLYGARQYHQLDTTFVAFTGLIPPWRTLSLSKQHVLYLCRWWLNFAFPHKTFSIISSLFPAEVSISHTNHETRANDQRLARRLYEIDTTHTHTTMYNFFYHAVGSSIIGFDSISTGNNRPTILIPFTDNSI